MAEIGLIPQATLDAYAEPNCIYAILGYFDFATGVRRLWSGSGTLRNVGGHDWIGVASPDGTRLVTVSEVQLPTPNVASAIRVGLTGVDRDYIEAVFADAATVEGRKAELFIQVFDGDEQPIGDPISFDPDSYMTSVKYRAVKMQQREVSVTIEGTWSAKNFAPGAQLTDADQRRREPGDRICQFAGWTVQEIWGPTDA